MSEQIAIQVPYGVSPGMQMKATCPDGRSFMITVPESARPGMTLMVAVPAATPVGSPMQASEAPAEPPAVSLVQQGTTMVEGVNTDDLCSVCALCCVILSCYPKFPECLGCHAKGVMTCIELETIMCKTGVADGSICMCCKAELEIIKPTVCIKMTEQLFCLDLRCAVPCDDEVPCMIGLLGLTCVKDYKCLCKCGEKLTSSEEEAGKCVEIPTK